MEKELADATAALLEDPFRPTFLSAPQAQFHPSPHPPSQQLPLSKGKDLSLLMPPRARRQRTTVPLSRKRRRTIASACTTPATPASMTGQTSTPSTSRANSIPLTNCSSSMTVTSHANSSPLPIEYIDDIFDKIIAPTLSSSSPLATSARIYFYKRLVHDFCTVQLPKFGTGIKPDALFSVFLESCQAFALLPL